MNNNKIKLATEITQCRPLLQSFAVAMENTLRKNDHKSSWEKEDVDYCLQRMLEEVNELKDVFENRMELMELTENPQNIALEILSMNNKIANESTDVANFAMFVYWLSLRGRIKNINKNSYIAHMGGSNGHGSASIM
jgi:hypothetical protein